MLRDAPAVEVSCPAKLNLSLAILGLRTDGFHALHSVVAQTSFADKLRVEWRAQGSPAQDCLQIGGGIIIEGDNTILQTIRLFRRSANFNEGAFHVQLKKLIPVGAGLGGGSSDAVAAIRAIRAIFPEMAGQVDWRAIASSIGSDCPLFLSEEPVIMEGRGEVIHPLPASLSGRFRGRPVILFKPSFPIHTGEAYRRLASASCYSTTEAVGSLMREWETGGAALPPRCNDFERLLDDWMPSLSVVLMRLQDRHGMDARLSGSGSACFVFPENPAFAITILTEELERAWGPFYWMQETSIK